MTICISPQADKRRKSGVSPKKKFRSGMVRKMEPPEQDMVEMLKQMVFRVRIDSTSESFLPAELIHDDHPLYVEIKVNDTYAERFPRVYLMDYIELIRMKETHERAAIVVSKKEERNLLLQYATNKADEKRERERIMQEEGRSGRRKRSRKRKRRRRTRHGR